MSETSPPAAAPGAPVINRRKALHAEADRLAQAGDLNGAVAALRAALQIDPDFPEIRGKLGLWLYELGLRTEAMAHLAFAVRRSPNPERWRRRLERIENEGLEPDDRRRLAQSMTALAKGRTAEALADFQDLTSRAPRCGPAWIGLKGALHALGLPQEAKSAEARWRQGSPPHRAGVEAALARPVSGRGLVFDPREPLPVRPIDDVLTRVESASELQRTPNSYFELDAGGQPIDCAPVIPLEPDGSDAMELHERTTRRLMARFDDALLAGRGLVVSRSGEVVSELLGRREFGGEVQGGTLQLRPDAFDDGAHQAQVFDTPALLMAGPNDRSYGDWINDFPPRLATAEAAGVDCAPVVRGDLGGRYVQMLSALGVDPDQLMRHNQFASIFPQLYVPSWPLSSRRSIMADWFGVYRRAWAPAPAERRRIYLTRRAIGRRALINEAEVAQVFARRGFDIVAPETLGMDEMIRLFAGPSVVAGPYGSAMRSLVFCHQKPVVFAIMPPYSRYFIEGSGLFFAQMGVRFAWVHGRPAPGADPTDPNEEAWTIDPDLVESRLERLLDYLADNAESG